MPVPTGHGQAAFWMKDDNDRAIADATEAIRLDPENAGAYETRASAFWMKNDYDRAIADATEAIRLDPKSAWAYRTRAHAYSGKNDYDRAIADATEAIRLDPENAGAYGARAMAYLWIKDFGRAFADAIEVIRLAPDASWAYCISAEGYFRKKDYDHAIADATQALRLDPNAEHAYRTRAAAYLVKYEIGRAIADATEAIRLEPKYSEVYGIRAFAYLRNGDIAGAIADATEAIRLDPKSQLGRSVLDDAEKRTLLGRLRFNGKLLIKMLVVVGSVFLTFLVIELIGRLHPLAAVAIYGVVSCFAIYQVSNAKAKAQKGEGWFCDRSLSDFADTMKNMPIEAAIVLLVYFLVVLFGTTAAFLGFFCKGLNAYRPDFFAFVGNTESLFSWLWYGIELQLHTMVPFVEWRKNVIQLSDIEPQGEVAGKVVGVLRWGISACNVWILYCAYKVVRAAVKEDS